MMWWNLEGRDVTELMGEHPFLRAMEAVFDGPDRHAAKVRAGVIATLLLSGHTTSVVGRAVGLDPDDDGLEQELRRVSLAVARAASS